MSVSFTITLPEEVYESLQLLIQQEKYRKRNDLVKEAVMRFLEQRGVLSEK